MNIRRFFIFLVPLVLAGLSGCSGGGVSSKEKEAAQLVISGSMTKQDADRYSYTGWDSTTFEDGGKKWKALRVKYTVKADGKGDDKKMDVVLVYKDKDEPKMGFTPINENTNGDDWKKDVKSFKRTELTE